MYDVFRKISFKVELTLILPRNIEEYDIFFNFDESNMFINV